MATAVKKKTATSNWSKVFPPDIGTQSTSMTFVKKLFAVSVSNIMYLRAIFPEQAFVDRALEGLNLKILNDSNKCYPGTTKVINWVRGCFDALDKQYLRSVIIGIYDDASDPDTVIESYTFKFSYLNADDGHSVPVGLDVNRSNTKGQSEPLTAYRTNEEIQAATIRLLRTMLFAAQTLKTLPDNTFLTMKLLYFDNITPHDYEPPGFHAAEYVGFRHFPETLNVKIGNVLTNFHGFWTCLTTDKNLITAPVAPGKGSSPADNNSSSNPSSNCTSTKTLKRRKSPASEDSTTAPNKIAKQVFKVICPCGKEEDDGVMIACDLCRSWQHALCYGIFEESDAPSCHLCITCATEHPDKLAGNKMTTCNQLLALRGDESARKIHCWMRCALKSFHTKAENSLARITLPRLARDLGCQMPIANVLFRRLVDEGALASGRTKQGKEINFANIEENLLPRYFRCLKSKENQLRTREH